MPHSSENSDSCNRSQYPGRDKLERNHSSQCKEEGYGDVRRSDHHRTVQEENYLVVDVRQERSRQWNSDQYSDSDEELLHESLRRLKLGQKGKIPSLMDLEFPPSISARNLEKGPADVQPNYSSTSHGDKHGRFTDAEFDDRSRSEYRSQSESGAEVQAGFRVHDRDTRHLESHTRKSGGDRRLLPSEYDIEHRCPDYVDYDGHRDNIRCGNYEADYRHYEQDDSVSSRRNKHGYIDQDAPRGNTGRLVDSRSPDFHRHSDSDQDSDQDGTRRSWREEKRSRHSKRKNEKSVDDEAKVKATKNVLKKDIRHSDRMSSLKKSEKSQSGKPSSDCVEDADSNSQA
ncbi:protein starmaker-like [Pomacea canaliculata]|uniref:protein starmaker-like n=1 Tax=Pomacea canaliculata TaxID=400727 RepID=UPI000D732441|nr:protein starmaker-like [Pomacea canaliculata]